MAKENTTNAKRIAIDKAHRCNKPTIGLLQQGQNIAHRIGSAFNRTLTSINKTIHVQFRPQHTVQTIKNENEVMLTTILAPTVTILPNMTAPSVR